MVRGQSDGMLGSSAAVGNGAVTRPYCRSPWRSQPKRADEQDFTALCDGPVTPKGLR